MDRVRRLGVGTWRAPLRRFGPAIVAAAALASILRKYSPVDIAARLHERDALRVVPFAALLAVTFLT